MAKIQGAFGQIRGKAGPWIFQMNKGAQILKEFAVPDNPQSSEQTTNRSKFASLVSRYAPMASDMIKPVWQPTLVGNQQSWGNFIGHNMLIATSVSEPDDCIVAYGSLEGIADLAAVYTTGTGDLSITWTGDIFGNGSAGDYVNVAVYDSSEDKIVAFGNTGDTREDENSTFSCKPGLTAGNLTVYLFLTKEELGSGEITSVSTSQTCEPTAP